jgi:hypothetical protein
MIALQEPSINFLNKTIAAWDWIPIYPSTHKKHPEKMRTVILVRGDICTESWEQLDFDSEDVTAICIKEEWGTLSIFNIYNDCEHNETIAALTEYHNQNTHNLLGSDSTRQKHHLLWLGDFNRHHPYWDNPEDNRLFTKRACDAAEVLLRCYVTAGTFTRRGLSRLPYDKTQVQGI